MLDLVNFKVFKGTIPSDFDKSFRGAIKEFAGKYLMNETYDHMLNKVKSDLF